MAWRVHEIPESERRDLVASIVNNTIKSIKLQQLHFGRSCEVPGGLGVYLEWLFAKVFAECGIGRQSLTDTINS